MLVVELLLLVAELELNNQDCFVHWYNSNDLCLRWCNNLDRLNQEHHSGIWVVLWLEIGRAHV